MIDFKSDVEMIEAATQQMMEGAKLGGRLMDQFEAEGIDPPEAFAGMAFVIATIIHQAMQQDEEATVAVTGMLQSALNHHLGVFHGMDEGDGTPTPGPLPENIQ